MSESKLKAEVRKLRLLTEASMYESLCGFGIDGFDMAEEMGIPAGGWILGSVHGSEAETRAGGFRTEQQHANHRAYCRWLYHENPFAKNAIENHVSYIIGPGLRYQVTPRDEEDQAQKSLADKMQADLDEWLEDAKWDQQEQEIVRRGERDGEAFVQFFDAEGESGFPTLRIREPSDVYTPAGKEGAQSDGEVVMGILFEKGDAATVLGYYVGGEKEPVDAEEIEHVKVGVDQNVARGHSTLWTPREFLVGACRTLKAMRGTTQAQGSIAAIRYHDASKSAVESFLAGQAERTTRSPLNGRGPAQSEVGVKPGTTLDLGKNTRMEFPIAMVDVEKMTAAVQADLRAAASAMMLPEWMLTSKLDSKYANAEVSEGPTGKAIERKRSFYAAHFRCIVMEHILAAKYEESQLEQVKLAVTSRDSGESLSLEEAQTGAILIQQGAMSRKTLATRAGLDYRNEKNELDKEDEGFLGGSTSNAPPTLTGNPPNRGVAEPPAAGQ